MIRVIQLFGTFAFISAYSPVTQRFVEYSVGEGYTLGIAVLAVASLYFIAAEIWPIDEWSVIGLALSGFLLLYGTADWFPTAFLWAMPLLTLDYLKNGKINRILVLYGLISAYVALAFNSIFTSGTFGFLFVPFGLVPFGQRAIEGAKLAVGTDIVIVLRSILSGFSIWYALSTAWSILRKRSRCR
jgi:hypothetical protein